MAESMLFGGYRSGYRVLPEGWMQAATAPGQNYADAIKSFAGSIASGIKTGMEGKAEYQTTAGSIPSQYKMYEQTAEVTGVPIDPTLTERYRNMDNLSLPEMKGLAKDIAGAQQNAIALANMQRQQAAFQAQQQALQQARYRQNLGTAQDEYLNAPAQTGAAPQLNFGGMNPYAIMNAQPGPFSSTIIGTPFGKQQ